MCFIVSSWVFSVVESEYCINFLSCMMVWLRRIFPRCLLNIIPKDPPLFDAILFQNVYNRSRDKKKNSNMFVASSFKQVIFSCLLFPRSELRKLRKLVAILCTVFFRNISYKTLIFSLWCHMIFLYFLKHAKYGYFEFIRRLGRKDCLCVLDPFALS